MVELNIEQYLNGKDIKVPASLRDSLYKAGFSDSVDETTYLVWFRIYCGNIENKEDFSIVSAREFKRMGLYVETVTKCKQWLENNGFISTKRYPIGHEYEGNPIKQFGTDKKTGKPKGTLAQSYQAHEIDEKLVSVTLERKDLLDALRRSSDNHRLTEYSKDCQNNLTVELDATSSFLNRIESILPVNNFELNKKQLRSNKAKRIRTQNTLRMFHHGLGYCHKGQKVDRIFTGWTASTKVSRKLLLLDGSFMEGFDLQASQPTLMACFLKDDALLEDCYFNALYQGIMEVTGTTREDAKKYFCWVCYGPLDLRWGREPREKKAMAMRVQNHLQKTYPVAFDQITERKKKHGNCGFAIEMMNAEARIFIDGIYAEMATLDIPSLLCHDALYVPKQFSKDAGEVMLKHLEKEIPANRIKLNRE